MVTLARAKEVSIEDIDSILLTIASQSRFSSPGIRAFKKTLAEKGKDATSDLGSLFSRLQARESKWLTRLILKTYAPVVLPAALVYRLYHYLLPSLLKVQNELPASLRLLASLGADSLMPSPAEDHVSGLDVLSNLRPLVGIKVGRPPFLKGRGIKHCVDMAQNRRMSIEKKYDGEYFQLHIDMSKTGRNRIKIFSKSGRDSTEDRVAVHRYVGNAVRYFGNFIAQVLFNALYLILTHAAQVF
jgi:DNA ligase 4